MSGIDRVPVLSMRALTLIHLFKADYLFQESGTVYLTHQNTHISISLSQKTVTSYGPQYLKMLKSISLSASIVYKFINFIKSTSDKETTTNITRGSVKYSYMWCLSYNNAILCQASSTFYTLRPKWWTFIIRCWLTSICKHKPTWS